MSGQFALFANDIAIFYYSSSVKTYIFHADSFRSRRLLSNSSSFGSHFTGISRTVFHTHSLRSSCILANNDANVEFEFAIFSLNTLDRIINPADHPCIDKNLEIVRLCDPG
jgi:hypothetical protein